MKARSNRHEPSSFDGAHFLTHVAVTRGQPLDEFITAKEAETVTSNALLKEVG